MAGVRLRQLGKTFGQIVAVDRVDLEIFDKELIVLVGPSGCGKTTTLRLIAGLEDVSSGEIWIGDRQVNRLAPKDRDIAMVFQRYALYPHMNVYKNMAFGLRMRRVPKDQIAQRIADTSKILGIEELLARKPAELSGGQQQRVALGRAMVRQPAAFLFDEPLSNLDAKLRVSMRTELVRLHQRLQTTMIHVTHDQVEAMMMGERIVVMNAGRIQQVGKPLDVYARPVNRFVAEFIGSPPMNFLRGTFRSPPRDRPGFATFGNQAQTIQLPESLFQELSILQSAPSTQEFELGVRPEHLQIRSHGTSEPPEGFPAEVTVVQPLGAETLIEVSHGDWRWLVRTTARQRWNPGDQIRVVPDDEHFHWFSADTGARIE